MGILNYNLVNETTADSFQITKQGENIHLQFTSGEYIDDSEGYIGFFKKLPILSFDSILVGGLGLGTLPQYIATETSCSVIDVVENNSALVDALTGMSVLDPKINIDKGDIYTYTPSKTYDLIVFDLWWETTETEEVHFHDVIDSILLRYNAYLNPGGNIYFPIYFPMDLFPSGSSAAIYDRPVQPES